MSTETPLQEALRAALSTDSNVRQRAALRLGTLADESVTGELVALLRSEPDPFVRETLTWAVTAQDRAAVPHLLDALAGKDPSRAQILHALSKIQDPGTMRHVVPLADDPTPEVAAKAWWAIGRTGVPATAPVLVAKVGMLETDEARAALTRALEHMGAPAVPGLAECLGSDDPAVRRHAAQALVAIGHPALGALDALVAAAQGEDRELAMLAMEALAPLDSPRVDQVLAQLRDGPSRWLATVADWLLSTREDQGSPTD